MRIHRTTGRPLLPSAALAALLALPAVSLAAFNFFDPSDPGSVPQTLSATGVYTNIAAKTTDTALKYYEVNTPLWSDGAHKDRWIVLPPGKHVVYNDTTDYLGYPDSTVFVKLFRHDTIMGDTTTLIYWETRLLVNRKNVDGFDNWTGFSYKWNKAATEAYLVDPDAGFDTAMFYYPAGLAQPQSYRKWHYPSQEDCRFCHVPQSYPADIISRQVLGFFPAQLKRPAPKQPGINQITWLFNQGVFTGTPPTDSMLARRWKSLTDPIPGGLTADQRFRVIDTMARSYLAANCSGCHGLRGASNGGRCPLELNFDYHNFIPQVEHGALGPRDIDLFSFDTTAFYNPRHRYQYTAARAGLDTGAGKVWNMTLPASASSAGDGRMFYPGFPGFSGALYKQVGKQSPAFDSLAIIQSLLITNNTAMATWLSSQPWGSAAWRSQLTSHGWTPDSLFRTLFNNQYQAYSWGDQMPPIATHLPDTAALRILGEWVKTYRTVYVVDSNAIVTRVKPLPKAAMSMPYLQNRVLIVPEGWGGKGARVRMIGVAGRVYPVLPVGNGRYAVPASAPRGVYFFQIGSRFFKASILGF